METLVQKVRAKARRLYQRQPVRPWFVMLDDTHWRAIIINTNNKVTLCTGPLAPGAEEALSELGTKLDTMLSKSTKGRTRKTP